MYVRKGNREVGMGGSLRGAVIGGGEGGSLTHTHTHQHTKETVSV